jgi:hypothetical protein
MFLCLIGILLVFKIVDFERIWTPSDIIFSDWNLRCGKALQINLIEQDVVWTEPLSMKLVILRLLCQAANIY